MAHPYEAAVQALQAEAAHVQMISNNLTNAASTGFKRGVAAAVPFGQSLVPGAEGAANGSATGTVNGPTTATYQATDFAQGALRQSVDPAHLALEGPGFFELRSGNQVHYTRAGAFSRDARGRLVDAGGFALQGTSGDVLLKSDQFRIAADGTVLDGEQPVGQLRLVDFANRGQLQRVGGASFAAAPGASAPMPVHGTTVRQGWLESSNVVSSHEMVQLMEAVKRFEFGHRIVQSQDDMLERAVRKLSEN